MQQFTTSPPGDDWNWLRQLQFSYHKLSQSFLTTWFSKATQADDSPPKGKHVRRIIVAFLRDPSVQPRNIAQYTVEQRPWRDDSRVAAKCLYILLILLQYRVDLTADVDVPHYTDRLVLYFGDHPPQNEKQQLYSNVAQRIGAIIHEKITFHIAHPNVHGNFHVPAGAELSPIVPALRVHLARVLYETHGIQAAVTASEDFVATVLWQPMVDETVSAYRLLKVIDAGEESSSVLQECEALISMLPTFPYIATTVVFPMLGEEVTIPRERYPKITDFPV
jgi:hypothetical protein